MFATPMRLSEFNRLLKEVLNDAFPDKYWVTAEIADCKTNASGHCYLELIEKKPGGDQLLAKQKAVIWSNIWYWLSAQFQLTTGVALSAGQQVLVEVSLNYHELYGLSLVITDIDPAYTLGDWAKRRQEILLRLKQEGILHLNKELPWPLLPKRLAVISSAKAAGYEDFCEQLKESGFAYEWQLFPALVQGNQAEASILQALDAILDRMDHFDVVVLIRGGGSSSDLSCFDSYELCSALAQFPLPIVTGIGHERDESVADLVAFRALKTPTAVAEFLNDAMTEQWNQLSEYQDYLAQYARQLLLREKQSLQQMASSLKMLTNQGVYQERMHLQRLSMRSKQLADRYLQSRQQVLSSYRAYLPQFSLMFLQKEQHRLALIKGELRLYQVEDQLKRGYSLTLSQGKIIKSMQDIKPGDVIETRLRDGVIRSQVLDDFSK